MAAPADSPTGGCGQLESTAVPLISIGCNYRSSSLETLEQLTVGADDLPKTLHNLMSADNLSEAVLLSTCNRVEVYAYAERFHDGCADAREALAVQSGLPSAAVADELYVRHDAAAVRHLFNVATGLDSVVIGEHEILGQVRSAWRAARAEGTTGITLDPLFRSAVEVGRQARATTAIGRGIASLSGAAVALAEARLGTLEGRSVLVLGAGKMGVGTLRSLAAAGVAELSVANRTWQRAEATAAACGGNAVPLSGLGPVMANADLLMTTTGASEIILEHSDIDSVMASREGAELLIVDVAVPRDVDPSAGGLPGVTLLDMDDISAFMQQGVDARSREVERVRAVVDAAVERYQAQVSACAVAPLISALRARADRICADELDRHRSRLGDLDPSQRAAVESLVKGVVGKLLHEPTVRLKDAAGNARGDRLAEALGDLFDL